MPARRAGPQRWTFPVRSGPVAVVVTCRLGDVWRRDGWRSRSLAWQPVADPRAIVGDQRLLPKLRGELVWSGGGAREEGVTLRILARYRPPGGVLGRLADRVVLHRVAEATLRSFLDDVAER